MSRTVLQLVQTFVEIGLWRKGPQDLPASRFLLVSVLVVYILTSFIQVLLLFRPSPSMQAAVLIIAVDVLMLLGWLWGALVFLGLRERFTQTVTALLGVGTLLALLDIIVRVSQLAVGPANELPYVWVWLRLFAIVLIMSRILMHALGRGAVAGTILAVTIIYSTNVVAQLMLQQVQGS